MWRRFFSGAHLAGGTDSSGYLSEARLWREGNLRITTPLANELTLANGQHPFIPAGYQPAGTGVGVPGYPPGLPLMMALAGSIGGDRAAFVVVPLSATGLIIVAFMLGRRLGGPETALIGAAAVGASPILIFQSVYPMSDVPAAFWWSLAVLLLTHTSNRTAALAGIAAAIACLVRPNLFALTPVLAGLSVWWGGRALDSWKRAIVFVAPPAIAAAAFVYLQQVMFGGATKTGYGPVESLFSIDHVWANVARYSRWTVFVQSALIVVSIAGPFVIRRRLVDAEMDPVAAARVAWSGLLLYAAASSHLPAVSRLRRLGVFPFPVAGSPGGAGPGGRCHRRGLWPRAAAASRPCRVAGGRAPGQLGRRACPRSQRVSTPV